MGGRFFPFSISSLSPPLPFSSLLHLLIESFHKRSSAGALLKLLIINRYTRSNDLYPPRRWWYVPIYLRRRREIASSSGPCSTLRRRIEMIYLPTSSSSSPSPTVVRSSRSRVAVPVSVYRSPGSDGRTVAVCQRNCCWFLMEWNGKARKGRRRRREAFTMDICCWIVFVSFLWEEEEYEEEQEKWTSVVINCVHSGIYFFSDRVEREKHRSKKQRREDENEKIPGFVVGRSFPCVIYN